MALYDSNDTEKTAPLDKVTAAKLQEHGHTVVDEDGEAVLLYVVTAAEDAWKAIADEAEKAEAEGEQDADEAETWAEAEVKKVKGKFNKKKPAEEAEVAEPSKDGDEIAANETPNAEDADTAATEGPEDPAPSNEDAVVESDIDASDRKGDGPANASDPGYKPTGL